MGTRRSWRRASACSTSQLSGRGHGRSRGRCRLRGHGEAVKVVRTPWRWSNAAALAEAIIIVAAASTSRPLSRSLRRAPAPRRCPTSRPSRRRRWITGRFFRSRTRPGTSSAWSWRGRSGIDLLAARPWSGWTQRRGRARWRRRSRRDESVSAPTGAARPVGRGDPWGRFPHPSAAHALRSSARALRNRSWRDAGLFSHHADRFQRVGRDRAPLAEGEQLITLRKGGIREENKHFEIEHDRFFLYHLRPPARRPCPGIAPSRAGSRARGGCLARRRPAGLGPDPGRRHRPARPGAHPRLR